MDPLCARRIEPRPFAVVLLKRVHHMIRGCGEDLTKSPSLGAEQMMGGDCGSRFSRTRIGSVWIADERKTRPVGGVMEGLGLVEPHKLFVCGRCRLAAKGIFGPYLAPGAVCRQVRDFFATQGS